MIGADRRTNGWMDGWMDGMGWADGLMRWVRRWEAELCYYPLTTFIPVPSSSVWMDWTGRTASMVWKVSWIFRDLVAVGVALGGVYGIPTYLIYPIWIVSCRGKENSRGRYQNKQQLSYFVTLPALMWMDMCEGKLMYCGDCGVVI